MPSFKRPEKPTSGPGHETPIVTREGAGLPHPAYEDELLTFYVGDAFAILEALAESPIIVRARSVGRVHFVTDPPYDERTHKGMRETPNRWKRAVAADARPGEKDLDFSPIDENAMTRFAKSAARISNGWTLAFCADSHTHLWRAALEAEGMRWRRRCLWQKTNPMPGLGHGPGQSDESFVALWNGDGASSWNAGGRGNIWTGPSERTNFHKTQKPLWLMESVVESFAMRGDLVIDPFAGSGTTGVAAKAYGCKVILIERDAAMAEKAIARVRSVREQLRLVIPDRKSVQVSLPHMPEEKLGRSMKSSEAQPASRSQRAPRKLR